MGTLHCCWPGEFSHISFYLLGDYVYVTSIPPTLKCAQLNLPCFLEVVKITEQWTGLRFQYWECSSLVSGGHKANAKNLYTSAIFYRCTGSLINFLEQFGEIVATTEHEEATIFADIDYSEIDKRRYASLSYTWYFMLCFWWCASREWGSLLHLGSR